jgi:hypothetical protein
MEADEAVGAIIGEGPADIGTGGKIALEVDTTECKGYLLSSLLT